MPSLKVILGSLVIITAVGSSVTKAQDQSPEYVRVTAVGN